MLYSERKRIKELQVREASGESVWTSNASPAFRNKLKRVVSNFGWVANEFDHSFGLKELMSTAEYIFASGRGERAPDFPGYIDICNDSDIPDVIESVWIAIRSYEKKREKMAGAAQGFADDINELLESYRINYSLENGEIIEFESREAHVSIVAPALKLMTSEGWESVEKSYQDGLKELAAGNASDAITDVTTALQEALRRMGCEGKDLASLLKSAKNNLLKGYDSKYVDAIDNLVSWSSANRANRGDSHKVAEVDKEDAWFVVHVVGILILRLSKMPTK